MSSIVTSSTGLRRIEIIIGGKRPKIHLGRMPRENVRAICVRVDALLEARLLRRRDPEAEKWCEGLDQRLRDRLVEIGLMPRRKEETLKGLVDMFEASRSHIKASTKAADKQATKSLLEFFGEGELIHKINAIDAEEWRQSLSKLATATAAKRVIKAKSLFSKAVKPWKLIESNPFDDLHAGSQKNDARKFFVDDTAAKAIMDACPDAEWRALFTLARWGGLRIPSEIEGLKWADFVWDRNRFLIHSPKTEHHEGGDERWCPIFPEIAQAIHELQDLAQPGSVYVFNDRRGAAGNLRSMMLKIVRRAGLTPWPRLFQNLRSSRQTELTETFPEHLVCAWLGNSPKVARGHYLQKLDRYFDMAAQNQARTRNDKSRQANLTESENADFPASGTGTPGGEKSLTAQSLSQNLRILRGYLTKTMERHGRSAESSAVVDEILELIVTNRCWKDAARAAMGVSK